MTRQGAVPFLAAVLVSAVSNVDNLSVGVAFGIQGNRIPGIPNLIIAALTMTGTALAVSCGHALSLVISPSAASKLGSLIIIAIGAGTLLASLSAVRTPTGVGERHARKFAARVGMSGAVSTREALVLGVALSLNNVGVGVGAGVAGVPATETTVLAGAFSLLAVGGGSALGQLLGRPLLGARAPLVTGVLLIAIGAVMLPAGL